MRRFGSGLLFVSLLAASPAVLAKGEAKPAEAKPAATKPAAKKAPPKKLTPVSADNKKHLAELYAGFKFGMTKDEVLGVLSKQLDERYAEKLKATTDMSEQDRLRREKKAELARVKSTYVAFEGKRTGWDVSIIEDEFAHNTGEAMLERWENQSGKNQRRFFFFHDGKLWKMFVSLDVSILPEDKKNFATFRGVMEKQYGPGDVEEGKISWRTEEFEVRALDKLKTYDALGVAISDPKVQRELVAQREAKAPPKPETPAVIKAVIDKDDKDHPEIKAGDSSAVDAVIKAQGGTPKKR